MLNAFNGISVLIPVFNYSAAPLLKALSKEFNLDFPLEIILLDDASTDPKSRLGNEKIATAVNAQYLENPINKGRAVTRNRLAESANFSHILFIDVDSLPQHTNFLKRYAEAAQEADVVAGGTVYASDPPNDPESMLRWAYGKQREQRSAELRQTEGFKRLSLNNFLIRKELFLSIKLQENLRDYGHEDTIFGLTLAQGSPTLLHIDNPVYHTGLDKSVEFLAKTEMAIANLYKLGQQNQEIHEMDLYKLASLLSKNIGGTFLFWLGTRFKRKLLNNLQSAQPKVGYLDLLKLWLLLGKMLGKNPSLFS